MKTCDIQGCSRPHIAKGWCRLHYGRAARNGGDPLARQRLRGETPEVRFWSRVDASGPCWLWTGFTHDGYGSFTVTRGDTRRAHRYAWETLVGPVPAGLVIDHLCRVRNCVNPDHMETVSVWENTRRGQNHSAKNSKGPTKNRPGRTDQ